MPSLRDEKARVTIAAHFGWFVFTVAMTFAASPVPWNTAMNGAGSAGSVLHPIDTPSDIVHVTTVRLPQVVARALVNTAGADDLV